jgi:hypothetical protein
MDYSLARRAINYNYRAQRAILKECKKAGLTSIKLNASKKEFDDYLLGTLKSCNEYNRLRLQVSQGMLDSHYNTALWSSTDDDETPLDDSNLGYKLSESAKACLDYDLFGFVWSINDGGLYTLETIEQLTGQDAEHIAHDFWLTRNGHGAGFWDGDYDLDGYNDDALTNKLGKYLTALSKGFGECKLYVGKDNLVYVY